MVEMRKLWFGGDNIKKGGRLLYSRLRTGGGTEWERGDYPFPSSPGEGSQKKKTSWNGFKTPGGNHQGEKRENPSNQLDPPEGQRGGKKRGGDKVRRGSF